MRDGCPFCEGNEAETPSERDAFARTQLEEKALDNYRRPNSPGWMVRSVPNRYPFVSPDLEQSIQQIGPYLESPNAGIQEVLVDVPYHVERLSELTEVEFEYLIHFYHRRMTQLRKEIRWKYVQLFKNQGAEAGASLSHLHSQLVGLPFVPAKVEWEQQFLRRYGQERGLCYHCEVLAYEQREKKRFVTETDFFSVFCPFASIFPYEMYVVPKLHSPCFVHCLREELDDLGRLLQKLVRKLEAVLPVPAYNLVLKNSPWEDSDQEMCEDEYYHWRLEILPRMTRIAGYELGTGDYVNPVLPEKAAQCLRDA